MATNTKYGSGITGAPQADFGLKPGATKTEQVNGVPAPIVAKAPVFDFSSFKFGGDASGENTLDKNYLNMRNLSIAGQLGGAGINNAQGISNALKSIPGFKSATPEDQTNTIKTIMGLIKSGDALDPTLQKIASNYNTHFETNPGVANRFHAVANDYGQATTSQNAILDFFKQYESAINPYLNNYADTNKKIGEDIVGKLDGMKDTFLSQYGPEGEQRNRMKSYYANVADVLASEQGKTANEIDAQARQSGASLGATRAARNKSLQENLKLATEYKAKEVADYDNLYKTLNEYTKGYIEAYGNSQDKYVKDTYAKLLEFKNNLGSALINAQAQLEQFKVQSALQDAAKTGIPMKNS